MSESTDIKLSIVWEGLDTDGYTHNTCGFFLTENAADNGRVKPKQRKAIKLFDGTYWLLDERGPIRLTDELEEAKKSGLAKLTDLERRALGV